MKRQHLLRTLAALALTILIASPWVTPVYAGRIVRSVIVITFDGTTQRFTSNTGLYSRKITFQADSANANTAYVGDSTCAGATTAMASLAAGQAWTPVPSASVGNRGDSYRLSDWYAKGTAGQYIRLVYETVQ